MLRFFLIPLIIGSAWVLSGCSSSNDFPSLCDVPPPPTLPSIQSLEREIKSGMQSTL